MNLEELQKPLTEIEKAELSKACHGCLTEKGQMLLRRLLFQVDHDRLMADEIDKLVRENPVARVVHNLAQHLNWTRTRFLEELAIELGKAYEELKRRNPLTSP